MSLSYSGILRENFGILVREGTPKDHPVQFHPQQSQPVHPWEWSPSTAGAQEYLLEHLIHQEWSFVGGVTAQSILSALLGSRGRIWEEDSPPQIFLTTQQLLFHEPTLGFIFSSSAVTLPPCSGRKSINFQ